jgi:hypothetical protein
MRTVDAESQLLSYSYRKAPMGSTRMARRERNGGKQQRNQDECQGLSCAHAKQKARHRPRYQH